MKNYKKILLAAAATLAFALDASAADKLRIGTEGAYPPFNGIDASGQAVGFDLDIGKALCAKMKTECEVVTSDWDGIIPALNAKKFDFIVVNYANGDMVGHTGIYSAIEKAVTAIDNCVKDTVEAAKANGYEVIIIADHGNADHALNEDGTPNTAHSLNPVPFVYVTANKDAKVENGVLADVAPSILHILGMEQPAEMTGKDLIK